MNYFNCKRNIYLSVTPLQLAPFKSESIGLYNKADQGYTTCPLSSPMYTHLYFLLHYIEE